MIHLGTSGFSYDDWRGRFYPPRLPRARMFDFYSRRFNAVEVNSTFYHIYSPRMMRSLVDRAEGRIKFAVKMSELVTHRAMLSPLVSLSYCRGIEPAAEAGCLGAILLQFPFRFHWNRENRRYLERVLAEFGCFPLVLEIRHHSWQRSDAWRFVHESSISLCMMDMPRLAGLPRETTQLTGPIGYVRFHGRNGAQWFDAQYPGARYDYHYSEDELLHWVEPIKRIEKRAETTFVFFNNHLNAQAPMNAHQLFALMGNSHREPYYEDLFSGQVIRDTPKTAAQTPNRSPRADGPSRSGGRLGTR